MSNSLPLLLLLLLLLWHSADRGFNRVSTTHQLTGWLAGRTTNDADDAIARSHDRTIGEGQPRRMERKASDFGVPCPRLEIEPYFRTRYGACSRESR
uniref:Putative secreted protein n=1 Tax=Anopheles marajoara TaxID=58244 RepID=A0A2M4C9D4_9DIPT